jgi:glucose-1-phosphate cytidylyltransferase
MQAVILCGGYGTRMLPLTEDLPKPMIEVGGRPILWHIMDHLRRCGFKEFVLLVGYQKEKIRDYFNTPRNGGFKIRYSYLNARATKGDRILKAKPLLDDYFLLCYGDDYCNMDFSPLLSQRPTGAMMLAVRPRCDYGVLSLAGDEVNDIIEKPQLEEFVNGGYILMNKKALKWLRSGSDETDMMRILAIKHELRCYFSPAQTVWKGMNTMKDVKELDGYFKEQSNTRTRRLLG